MILNSLAAISYLFLAYSVVVKELSLYMCAVYPVEIHGFCLVDHSFKITARLSFSKYLVIPNLPSAETVKNQKQSWAACENLPEHRQVPFYLCESPKETCVLISSVPHHYHPVKTRAAMVS